MFSTQYSLNWKVFVLLFICLSDWANGGKCPASEVVNPCECVDENISCGGEQNYNLKQVFQAISNHTASADKHFRRFHFNNKAITEFPEDVFVDITFEEIIIENAANLTRIHSHAFTATNSFTKFVFIYQAPLTSVAPDYNIYAALSAIVNVEKIELRYTRVDSLPAYAFNSTQSNLKSIWIHESNITSVGNNAFYALDNLEELVLNYNQISFVSANAFQFRSNSNTTLEIYFTGNELNTSKSFSNASFANVNRPFILYFDFNSNLTYLDQNIFEPILKAGNSVQLRGVKLMCDCRVAWIYKLRTQYVNQVLVATCSDGKPFFVDNRVFNEFDEFNTC